MRLVITTVLLTLALGACAGSSTKESPVGIGKNPHALKKSPCACNEIHQVAPNGQPIVVGGAA